MQATNNQERFFFVQLNLVSRARVGEWRIEPFIKRLDRVEDFWENKVEERPQLGKVVLERGTSENETKTRMIVLRKRLR